jgi:hypothetical protein
MDIYFLIYSIKHPDGVIVCGREALRAYYSGLTYSERQGLTQLEFDAESLPSVLKTTGCAFLVLS